MTLTPIRTEPPEATPDDCEQLYRAWRYARAQWELAANDPAQPEGLTEEEDGTFCDAEHSALMAFLLHPISVPDHLALKLRVIRDEQGWRFTDAAEIFDRLCGDAARLVRNGRTLLWLPTL